MVLSIIYTTNWIDKGWLLLVHTHLFMPTLWHIPSLEPGCAI